MSRNRLAALALALSALLASSCKPAPQLVEVEGTVTYDGQPLSAASLSFEPVRQEQRLAAAQGAYAHSDEQGRFTLRQVADDSRGAPPGRYHVRVTTAGSDQLEGEPSREHMPLRYRDGSLQVDIPPADRFELPLELLSHDS